MHQPHLLKKIGREFYEELLEVRNYDTPEGTREKLIRIKDDQEKEKESCLNPKKQTRYRSGVGILLYLVKFSRPDI